MYATGTLVAVGATCAVLGYVLGSLAVLCSTGSKEANARQDGYRQGMKAADALRETKKRKRHFTPQGLANIREGQKLRWQKHNAAKSQEGSVQ